VGTGEGLLSLEVKRWGREAYHPPPSRAEVKNAWNYISIHQYVFMAWYLAKHRNNFTVYCVCFSVMQVVFLDVAYGFS
jgi:hypothetical protein